MNLGDRLYSYKGPVVIFGKCVDNCWVGITRASSKQKAKNNLKYQYKSMRGLSPTAKVDLPGALIYNE